MYRPIAKIKMAFSVEVQSSLSRPQAHNNTTTNTNQSNQSRYNNKVVLPIYYYTEAGVQSVVQVQDSANDYDNHKLRKSRKYNLDDTGTTLPPPTTTNGHKREINPNNIIESGSISIDDNENKFGEETLYDFEYTRENCNNSNHNRSENSRTIFETKNIFAYQACEFTIGSEDYTPNSGSPPERVESGVTPPPRNDEGETETRNNENHKNQTGESTPPPETRKYSENTREPGCDPPIPGSAVYAQIIRKQVTRLFANSKQVFESNTTTTTERQVQYNNHNSNNTNNKQYSTSCDQLFEQVEPKTSGNRQEAIVDFGIDGRHRVDRCRYVVPYSSGYEWSNAAYCYSWRDKCSGIHRWWVLCMYMAELATQMSQVLE